MVFERQVLSLAILEKELYQLYTNIAQKVEDVSARTLFSYIATDSLKHSTILATIIDEVNGTKANEQDCDPNIRHNKAVIKTLAKDIAKYSPIDREDLILLLEMLAGFEVMLLSEYRKAFHLEYAKDPEYKSTKDSETELNIFTLIVEDEERHQKILSKIVNICDKQLTFKHDAPIVKYQTPDSWYVPPRR
jgi:rubrerythrin